MSHSREKHLRSRLLAVIVAVGLSSASVSLAIAGTDVTTPLISRSAPFGNPERAHAELSPDGKWLAWLAPKDGVLNVWVAPLDKLAQAQALTNEKERPLAAQQMFAMGQ